MIRSLQQCSQRILQRSSWTTLCLASQGRLQTRRCVSTRLSNDERIELEQSIKEHGLKPQKEIIMDDLMAFKTPVSEEVLLKNAETVLHDISIRLAHRLEALRYLDYLIILNPHISQIYSLYCNSFRVMTGTKPPQTLEENTRFVQVLDHLVESHKNTIPTLAKGFYEARRYISTAESSKILDTHLRARIGTRLIAQHHISLSNPVGDNYIGAIQTDCKPGYALRECAEFVGEISDMKYGTVPQLQIDQGEELEFPYVPVHMEYIFTELLKNSFRAVIENKTGHIPVLATIVRTSQGMVIRIRDRGGGISPQMEKQVFGFAFSTFDDGEGTGFTTLNSPPGGGGSSIAGLGYGLPLSRAYAEFFGGKLQIQSYYGWGTDVYITLKSPVHRPMI